MGTRLGLHKMLCQVLIDICHIEWLWDPFNFEKDTIDSITESQASKHVYFQPPETVKMEYPCIVYERSTAKTTFAENLPYHYTQGYTVTVIDKNPDSLIPIEIAKLPMCTFDRHFTVDNLNHDVFNIYY